MTMVAPGHGLDAAVKHLDPDVMVCFISADININRIYTHLLFLLLLLFPLWWLRKAQIKPVTKHILN